MAGPMFLYKCGVVIVRIGLGSRGRVSRRLDEESEGLEGILNTAAVGVARTFTGSFAFIPWFE